MTGSGKSSFQAIKSMALSKNVVIVVCVGAFIILLLAYSLSGTAKGSELPGETPKVWPSSSDQGPLWLTPGGLASVTTTAPEKSEKVSLALYCDQSVGLSLGQ